MLHLYTTCVLNSTCIQFPFFVPIITTRRCFLTRQYVEANELLEALAILFAEKET
jgi:predicted amidophosphoribosyltransferase